MLHKSVLWWGDTIGLGAFSIVGAQAALTHGISSRAIVALCGLFTATTGGIVRDLLCGRQTALLFSPESGTMYLYGFSALVGAATYVASSQAPPARATDRPPARPTNLHRRPLFFTPSTPRARSSPRRVAA